MITHVHSHLVCLKLFQEFCLGSTHLKQTSAMNFFVYFPCSSLPERSGHQSRVFHDSFIHLFIHYKKH